MQPFDGGIGVIGTAAQLTIPEADIVPSFQPADGETQIKQS